MTLPGSCVKTDGQRCVCRFSPLQACTNLILAIHGDKQQNERDWVLNEFKTGKSPIMVATDVASRGIGMIDHDPAHLPFPSPQLTSCGCEEVVLSSLHPHCALYGLAIATSILVPVWLSLLYHLTWALVSLENSWLFTSAARLRAHALSLIFSRSKAYFCLFALTSGVRRRRSLVKGLVSYFIAAR